MHPLQKISMYFRDNRKQASQVFAFLGFGLYMLVSFVMRGNGIYGAYSFFSVVLPLLGLALGVLIFTLGFELLRQKNLMENIPRSKARSAAMGLAEVQGKAAPYVWLKSPLTLTECLYYKFLVEKYEQEGKNSRWKVVNEGSSTHFFYVEDETGKILVDPVDAELHLASDYKYTGTDIISSGKAHTYSTPSIFGGQRMRYTEWYIVPNDTVYAIGTVKKWKSAFDDHKFKVAEKLKAIKEDKERLKKFDLDGNGQIDCDEWEMARQQAEQDLLKEQLEKPQQMEDDVVISRDPSNNIMIISDQDERQVIKNKTIQAGLSFVSGGGLIVWMAYLLLKNIVH
ncbi:MAG: GIDE domain-containing protein [bacterium]|nr:GIDE domain-containing protein [bacterium]